MAINPAAKSMPGLATGHCGWCPRDGIKDVLPQAGWICGFLLSAKFGAVRQLSYSIKQIMPINAIGSQETVTAMKSVEQIMLIFKFVWLWIDTYSCVSVWSHCGLLPEPHTHTHRHTQSLALVSIQEHFRSPQAQSCLNFHPTMAPSSLNRSLDLPSICRVFG